MFISRSSRCYQNVAGGTIFLNASIDMTIMHPHYLLNPIMHPRVRIIITLDELVINIFRRCDVSIFSDHGPAVSPVSSGGSITRPLVLFDPLSYVILSTSMRRGWGGVFHVITEFVMMLVVGLVEGCLSLSEMEPLTVRSPLILPCIVV